MLKIKTTKDTQPRRLGHLLIKGIEGEIGTTNFSVFHVTMPPGKSHETIAHPNTQEWVYVLKGSAKAMLDGKHVVIKEADFFHIPPGCSHSFHAEENGIEVISIFSPSVHWDKPDVIKVEELKTK